MTRSATTTALLLVVVAIVSMVLTTSGTAVRVVRGDDGSVLVCQRVAPGTRVDLTFTHSMYGGDVTEAWSVSGDSLERVSILTDNAAAAEYYAWDSQVERSGDRFRVVTTPLQEPALVVRVDQIGQHRLMIENEIHDLWTTIGGTAQVRIEPVSAPAWRGIPC
jgi:hypothetical protein